tara:strand:- start:268 stop:1137 length:870 start_codon:yes stop_codon:yes gene_type:complete
MNDKTFINYNWMPLVANHCWDSPKEFYASVGVSRLHDKDGINPDEVKKDDIVFVKTDYIYNGNFINLLKAIKHKFTLISAISSYNVGLGHPSYIDIINSDKIKHWFCTNPPNVDSEKVTGLPIGFEEREREGGNQEVIRKHWKDKPRWQDKIDKIYLSYHTLGNNPNRDRNIKYLSSLPCVVTEKCKLSFDKYLEKMRQYKYVICLEGAGFDTHRNYEALLVGSIPIMINSTIKKIYDDWNLPSIFVDNWTQINSNYLSVDHEKLAKLSSNVESFLKIKSHKERILKYA